MSSCSPGCASTLSLRGTELDPGPVTMGSAGTNHDGSSSVRQGCWRQQEAEHECWRRQGHAVAERQGSGGTGSGLLRRAAVVEGRNAGHGRGHSALGRLRRRFERN